MVTMTSFHHLLSLLLQDQDTLARADEPTLALGCRRRSLPNRMAPSRGGGTRGHQRIGCEAELRRNASQILLEWPRSRLRELDAADVACFPSSDCFEVFARWVQEVHALAPEVYQGLSAEHEVSDAWAIAPRRASRLRRTTS